MSERKCSCCGIDITGKSPKAKICGGDECKRQRGREHMQSKTDELKALTPKRERQCKQCGVDISDRGGKATFCCTKCGQQHARAQRLLLKASQPKPPRCCKFCGGDITSGRRNRNFCDYTCINKHTAKLKSEHLLETDPTAISCLECGATSHSLTSHIVNAHNMSVADYKVKHGDAAKIISTTMTATLSERVSGENNPGFKHGGRLSVFSQNFIKYDGLSDEEKYAIIRTKQDNKFYPTENRNVHIDFYLKRGMSQADAETALSARQCTFSKEICIEKHGDVEGIAVWEARQRVWMESFNDRSAEEMADIIQRRTAHIGIGGVSMISVKLFTNLDRPDSHWGAACLGHPGEKVINLPNGRYAMVDFAYGNKIIEFFGDMWHANPLQYDSGDIIPCIKKDTAAGDIWAKDFARHTQLVELGYEVLIVWERDFNANPTSVIARCNSFLT